VTGRAHNERRVVSKERIRKDHRDCVRRQGKSGRGCESKNRKKHFIKCDERSHAECDWMKAPQVRERRSR